MNEPTKEEALKRIEEMADAAGRLAGLSDEQIPGLTVLFEVVWRDGFEHGRRAAPEGGPRG